MTNLIPTESIAHTLETRVEMAWLMGTSHCDNILVDGNRLENPDKRYCKRFTFARKAGIIDGDDFVMWGGMGFHAICAGPELRAAITKQTGVAI